MNFSKNNFSISLNLIFIFLIYSCCFTQAYISSIHHCGTFNSNDGSIDLSIYDPLIPYAYIWNTGDTTQDLSGLVPGIYAVTVSSEAACVQFIEFTISDCSILDSTDYQNLSFTLTASGDPSNNEAQIVVNPVHGSGIYYYKWSGPNGEVSAGRIASNLSVGLYCVTVTDGCSDYDDCIDLQSSYQGLTDRRNLKAEKESNSYHFYPNPFSTQLQLIAQIQKEGTGSVVIRDALGRELYRKNLYWQNGLNQFAFDLPMIKNDGLYYAECYLNEVLENRSKVGKN